jgi:enoyl-CoA hydratase/carnithine racemase
MTNPLNDALVLTTVHNGIATITLNRPKAMNALNLAMVQAMQAALTAWEADPTVIAVVLRSSSAKALCAGGDIRFFHASATAGDSAALADFFTQEYALNLHIAHYSKPYIAVMQGVVMGGGMGIAATARLRIVTDNSKLAMPETKIGLFPDVGGTHFLAQLRGHLGVYLGMTGTVLDAAGAQWVGLADAYCPAEALEALFEQLAAQRFVNGDAVLHFLRSQCAAFASKAHSQTLTNLPNIPNQPAPPRLSDIAVQQAWINTCFAGDSVASIIAELEAAAKRSEASQADQAAWAAGVLTGLKACSPLMLHVAMQAIVRAKSMTLAQALQAEAALMKRCFDTGEPVEGIRALAVDKDHTPKWLYDSWRAVPLQTLQALLN